MQLWLCDTASVGWYLCAVPYSAVQDVVVQYGLFVVVRDRILLYGRPNLRLGVAMPWQLFS